MELGKHRISHDRQRSIRILYDDSVIGMHRVDLMVEQKVIIELKAVKKIEDVHLAICLSYLKAANLHVGLVINFADEKTRVRRVYRPID